MCLANANALEGNKQSDELQPQPLQPFGILGDVDSTASPIAVVKTQASTSVADVLDTLGVHTAPTTSQSAETRDPLGPTLTYDPLHDMLIKSMAEDHPAALV